MFCTILLLLVAVTVPHPNAYTGLEQCQGSFVYLIEADSGGYYGLVGLPTDLRSQYANHTTRISVDGTFYPTNPSEYLHPDPRYRGLIYVTQYVINGVTISLEQTGVLVSGTLTTTSTNTNRIAFTTVNIGTSAATLAQVSESGWLDYTNAFCVTPLLATPTLGSAGTGLTTPIPGFTTLSILLGLLLGLTLLGIRKTREGRGRKSSCHT
jgi:hypothetical protein